MYTIILTSNRKHTFVSICVMFTEFNYIVEIVEPIVSASH